MSFRQKNAIDDIVAWMSDYIHMKPIVWLLIHLLIVVNLCS